ncbi:glycine betaine ABC transporter substrate-binding protein [Shimazuella alba]|uniref:Osmoprotectant ABC transporter substrate-binding protein n=1 Tax=Shimazuella alba TaxID=2690964 RepID=A0A6I4VTJ0_9BACL|nr:glycine betaine ABC transporter substrate-binding protein [Shimazuella alba]MXQ53485.1 osmoprotectant ABC transporter substrate-binding protein [Shimazuella alba]
MRLQKALLPIALSMLILLSGCTTKDTITVGTQTFTETKILGYMYKYLIEQGSNVNVDVKTDLSSSPFIVNALKENEIQLGTLYTGEIFNDWFPIQQTKDKQSVLRQAQQGFSKYYHYKWYTPLGFENTYAFTVTKEVADKYNLKKISDLRKVAKEMRLGVDTSWMERDNDGYKPFVKTYGLSFKNVFPMEINLVYKAVANKQMDIVLAYSSDARIKQYNLVTLEDDRHFFPPYDASTVALEETLKKYPAMDKALKKLSGKIDIDTMRTLNAKVDIDMQEPEQVAKEFLQQQGLLKK